MRSIPAFVSGIALLQTTSCVNVAVYQTGEPVLVKRGLGVVCISQAPEGRGFAYASKGIGAFVDHSEVFVGYRSACAVTNLPPNSTVIFGPEKQPCIHNDNTE